MPSVRPCGSKCGSSFEFLSDQSLLQDNLMPVGHEIGSRLTEPAQTAFSERTWIGAS